MRHASDLQSRTLCGLLNKELNGSDRSLAALIPDIQALVNCPTCRDKLGLEPISK